MEEIITIIEVAETVTKGLAPLVIAGIASAIPGIAKGIGSLFGGRKRRRAEDAASRVQASRMKDFEATEFTNPYAQVQNQFDDMQVNLQSAQLQQQTAQQLTQQGLSQGIDAGMDAASLAQRLSGVLGQSQQRISADIGKQEAMNQKLSAQGAMQAAQLQAGGEAQRQQLEMGKQSQLLGMANQNLAAATGARTQAKNDLFTGIGALGSAAAIAGMGGVFGGAETPAVPQQSNSMGDGGGGQLEQYMAYDMMKNQAS